MKRSKHSLSHYHLTSIDQGTLVPLGVFEVLPGDTVQMSTSALVRAAPLVAPVMHPVHARVHHWLCRIAFFGLRLRTSSLVVRTVLMRLFRLFST